MAYAAVISLKQTIQHLKNSFLDNKSPQIIEFAYKEVVSLQEVLTRLDSTNNRSKRLNDLDEQIKETVHELEHVLESYVLNRDVDSLIESAKQLKEDYIDQLGKQMPEEEEEEEDDIDEDTDSRQMNGFGWKMVGLDDEFSQLKYFLLHGKKYVALLGMAGIGKTRLARQIYEDQSIREYFDRRVWVTVGPKYQLEEIVPGILAQTDPYIDQIIKGDMKFLIVLDDVWDEHNHHDLERLIPYHSYNAVLLTSRLSEAAYNHEGYHLSWTHCMKLLNNEESWKLFQHRVFGEDHYCPYQLEKAGRKIAENCDGLPLTIVVVADILSKIPKTTENWENAADKNSPVFADAYDQMWKVLIPSYKYLPQYLKACFLYMVVFPQNYVIPIPKLVMLWIAEGLLEPNPSETMEDIAMEYLNDLDGKNVILLQKTHNFETKTCSLHSVFWHLCNREARKSKFSHVMNKYADGLAEVIKSQRRLCIHNNILLAIKDVYKSIETVLDARSLLCTGPHHQYPVPICFGLRFLKILDALTIHLYEFPVEVVELVRLKYLALTCNENLPTSISKLLNLQSLIVDRHLSIKSSENPSYLPDEIWEMKELKHLHVTGYDLQNPRGALLPNLVTLLDVGARSCTGLVFSGIPNLEKLGIRIELAPDGDVEPLNFFHHISYLHKLESLKCVVVNPNFKSEAVSLPPGLSIVSPGLKKLTLRGLGYPWKYMREIELLPSLEVLKLRNYAFRGPKWETREDGFPRLNFLSIEDSDLVHWTGGFRSFSSLLQLRLKHCYKLQDMPREVGDSITAIDVVDCSPSAEAGAKHIKHDQFMNRENFDVEVSVHCSWDE